MSLADAIADIRKKKGYEDGFGVRLPVLLVLFYLIYSRVLMNRPDVKKRVTRRMTA